LELVSQPYDLSVHELGAVALDDAPRFSGVLRMYRDPDLAQCVHHHREHTLWQVRCYDCRYAMGLEKPPHDAGLDVGPGAENGDEVSAHRCSARAPERRGSPAGARLSSIFKSTMVISSCCGALPTNASIS